MRNVCHSLQSKPTKLAIAIGLALQSPAAWTAVTCDVTVADDDGSGETTGTLSWAIKTANNGKGAVYADGHPGSGCTGDTITLKTDVRITGVMKRLIDSDLTIESDDITRTIDGDNTFRPLFVKSGHIVLRNLNLANGLAKGGDTRSNRDGGAGAGLGGALFVYSGNISVEDSTFDANEARGGGHSESLNGQAGGGMLGAANGSGGGGLFGSSTGSAGAYSGTGDYGGGTGGFGGGGSYGTGGAPGGNGGFGGGGGASQFLSAEAGGGVGGDGGFGGGGAYGESKGGYGGFGAGGWLWPIGGSRWLWCPRGASWSRFRRRHFRQEWHFESQDRQFHQQ